MIIDIFFKIEVYQYVLRVYFEACMKIVVQSIITLR